MRRVLARLVPAYGRLLDDLQRTRDQLAAARRAAAAAKGRIGLLEAREARLRARVDRLEAGTRRMKASFAARTPSATVLEEVAARRLAALTASSRRGAARSLEDAFSARSSAYRDARATEAYRAVEHDGPAVAAGLQWWVPRRPGTDPDSLEARLVRGRLSLYAILASREVAQGTIMLDIGANIGTTSLPRVVLGDFQTVYAAEPEPANYACLVQNVVANGLGGFVLPDRVAIADRTGEIRLEVTRQIGTHRVVADLGDGPGPDARANLVTVPCSTLDDWIDAMGIDPGLVAFVKCDVEGAEPQVLAGARRTLARRHIAWQLEVSPKHLARGQTMPADLGDLLRAHFDRFIDLRGAGGRGRPMAELDAVLTDLVTTRRYTDLVVYNA